MAEYTKEDIFEIITEYLELYGSALGSYSVRELTPAELTDATLRVLTIPSMMPETEEWVCTSLRNMLNPIDNAVTDLTTLKQETAAARDAANAAAEDVQDAVDQAETVNASLVGFTVTITDHDGVSRSVDIGFEIYRTYTSVSAMNADAANVPQGKFVVIATTDPTSEDNAKMYCKNSQGSFTFLCDLDQASSAAWADWLNNMKPEIQSATAAANTAAGRVDTVIATANADHTRAEADHTTAGTDHSTAQTDHTTAGSDHTLAESDHATAGTDHTRAESDHTTASTDHTQASTDHTTAESDHTTASTDHSTAADDHTQASADHSTASTDHITATNDHTTAQSDHTQATAQTAILEEWNTHQPYIGNDNYWYIWNTTTDQYVRSVYAKGDDLHWEEMTEEEKNDLAARVLAGLVFASEADCRAIVTGYGQNS